MASDHTDPLLARADQHVRVRGLSADLVARLAERVRTERAARERAEELVTVEHDRAEDHLAAWGRENAARERAEQRLAAWELDHDENCVHTGDDLARYIEQNRALEQQLAAIDQWVRNEHLRLPLDLTEYGEGRRDVLNEARALLDASTTEDREGSAGAGESMSSDEFIERSAARFNALLDASTADTPEGPPVHEACGTAHPPVLPCPTPKAPS